MRKYGRKFCLACWIMVIMMVFAIVTPGMFITDRMILLLGAALVACVYIVCETKIDCAAAPLNLPEEMFADKEKPPEDKAE